MSKFEVGDTVWCLIYGKGVVINILGDGHMYPVCVDFPDIDFRGAQYTRDGKYQNKGRRTLFFSEPKVEVATVRPFKSALIDHRIMVMLTTGETRAGTVLAEDEISITINRINSTVFTYYKKDLVAVYKLSDNLL